MPGDVVELVDTLGLEPSAARRGGSTPSIPTNLNHQRNRPGNPLDTTNVYKSIQVNVDKTLNDKN